MEEINQMMQRVKDSIYYADVLPPVGDAQLSYSRFIELLEQRKVKRIHMLGDGRLAVVEVPCDTTVSDYQTMQYDPQDLGTKYCKELPEFKMERFSFYCELPGDFWEDPRFMYLLKRNLPHRTAENRQYYGLLLKEDQCYPELVVYHPNDANAVIGDYVEDYKRMAFLIGLRMFVSMIGWVQRILFPNWKKKDKKSQFAEKMGATTATEFNVSKDGKAALDTGVKFDDVAGIEHIKEDMRVYKKMLLGDPYFQKMGCKCPKGILLEGPPGTGKTYLAKAMAGECGIPFYSCNGAEFVEMFQGVAAARIRDLFKKARKNAPAIIFIDELDALGRARSSSFADPGTMEREQGLMQLLVEMDGILSDSPVLILAATNRKDILDEALLRPGRFDKQIYMGPPGPDDRVKILRIHSKNKPLSLDNNVEAESAMLSEVGDSAVGLTGAELANLVNEAAILSVRCNHEHIELSDMLLALEKQSSGLPHQRVPQSAAKEQLAKVIAGKAVAMCLTPGVPPLKAVSIRGRGSSMASLRFQAMQLEDGGWLQLAKPGRKVNATTLEQPLGSFEYCCNLLVPLMAGRAVEELLFGPQRASLLTSADISEAGNLAWWLTSRSFLHPLTRASPVHFFLIFDHLRQRDSTTAGQEWRFERCYVEMLQLAYRRAQALVTRNTAAIEQVAGELMGKPSESLTGNRVIEIIETAPKVEAEMEVEATGELRQQIEESPGFKAPQQEELMKAGLLVSGNVSLAELVGPNTSQQIVDNLQNAHITADEIQRLATCSKYATDEAASFPLQPADSKWRGHDIWTWTELPRGEDSGEGGSDPMSNIIPQPSDASFLHRGALRGASSAALASKPQVTPLPEMEPATSTTATAVQSSEPQLLPSLDPKQLGEAPLGGNGEVDQDAADEVGTVKIEIGNGQSGGGTTEEEEGVVVDESVVSQIDELITSSSKEDSVPTSGDQFPAAMGAAAAQTQAGEALLDQSKQDVTDVTTQGVAGGEALLDQSKQDVTDVATQGVAGGEALLDQSKQDVTDSASSSPAPKLDQQASSGQQKEDAAAEEEDSAKKNGNGAALDVVEGKIPNTDSTTIIFTSQEGGTTKVDPGQQGALSSQLEELADMDSSTLQQDSQQRPGSGAGAQDSIRSDTAKISSSAQLAVSDPASGMEVAESKTTTVTLTQEAQGTTLVEAEADKGTKDKPVDSSREQDSDGQEIQEAESGAGPKVAAQSPSAVTQTLGENLESAVQEVGSVRQDEGKVSQGQESVSQGEGSLSEAEVIVRQGEGNVSKEVGSVSQSEASVSQAEGTVSQEVGSVRQGEGSVRKEEDEEDRKKLRKEPPPALSMGSLDQEDQRVGNNALEGLFKSSGTVRAGSIEGTIRMRREFDMNRVKREFEKLKESEQKRYQQMLRQYRDLFKSRSKRQKDGEE